MSAEFASNTFDVQQLGELLPALGFTGRTQCKEASLCDRLIELQLAVRGSRADELYATSHLYSIGPSTALISALRRVLSIDLSYRTYLLFLLLESLSHYVDDEPLGETLEQLDHITPELLHRHKSLVPCPYESGQFNEWNRLVWQSPDGVTLLSKVVESPRDFPELPKAVVVAVGFDWLEWETPPICPAPAPWADARPLQSPLETVQHPFWGAMVATLDACAGDYEWQSLILRGDFLRSFHRTLGNAQVALDLLWRSEFGLYPVDPLVISPNFLRDHPLSLVSKTYTTGRSCLPWLKIGLDQLQHAEIAIESEGSWRLTDRFRTQLMKDDEHMMAFEAIRQRSYRLARSATRFSLASTNEGAAS